MKKTLKKGLAYLLAVSMIITYMPATTFALEGVQADPGQVSLEMTVDGITVTAEAEAGVLPEDASLDVSVLKDEDLVAYTDKVEADLEGEILNEPVAIEVKFVDGEGTEIQPEGDVDLTISNDAFEGKTEDLSVYFFEENEEAAEKQYENMDTEADGDTAIKVSTSVAGVFMVTDVQEEAADDDVIQSEAMDPVTSEPDAEEPVAEEPAKDVIPSEARDLDTSEVADGEGTTAEAEAPATPMDFAAQADNGVNVIVNAPAGAFPAGTIMEVKTVSTDEVIGAVSEAVEGSVKSVKAVDITFYDKEGKEIEPQLPISVKMFTTGMSKDSDKKVFHMEGEKAQPMADAKTTGVLTSASFESDAFSIYAIVETGTDARALVKFMNGNTEIKSMYVKENDDMKVVLYDPGAGELAEGVYFRGWTTEPNYTTKTKALTIEDVRTAVEGQLSPSKDGTEITYYAMLFKDYRITYLDENDISLGQEEVTFRADSTSTEQPYTVNMGYTVQDDTHHFEGWNVVEGGNSIVSHTEGKIYQNLDNIKITGDVTFGVNAPEGHWFIFDENGGGTYNAPQFIYSNDKPTRPSDSKMIRNGYTFGGWYADKATADQASGGMQYDFTQTLSDKTTVYARWIPKTTANYTVIIWKENINGDGYDFEESIPLSGTVGRTINTVTRQGSGNNAYARVNGANKQYTGFRLKDFDQNVTIKTEGNSIVNIYYDRNEYTLTFQVQGVYTYTPTTDNDGTQYGLVNGEYVQLTRHNSGNYWNPSYYWTYGDTYWSEGTSYTGTRYTRSGGRYQWSTVKTINAKYGTKISDQFPIAGYENYMWQSQNSNTFGNRWITIADIMPAENVTFHGVNGGTGYKMQYWVQPTNMSTNYNDYELINSITAYPSDADGYLTYEEDFMEMSGFTRAGSDPAFINGSIYHRGNGTMTVNFYYNRKTYPINFMDGKYVDGDGNPMEEAGIGQLGTETGIGFNADVTSYNNYKPSTTPAGYVFEGWYVDDECTHPYTFNKMPEGGITVYAKWRQKEYRVFLHPNYPDNATGNIDWGTTGQKLVFRVSEGEHVSEPTGRLIGYEFVGWYFDAACTQVFNGEAYPINESNVTTPYDKTVDMTDTYDNNGNLINPKFNSDATGYNGGDRFWITKKLDIYAKWRATLEGASGIVVEYDATNNGTGAPTDTHTYVDGAKAPAGAASKSTNNKKVFGHWIVQKWNGSAWEDTSDKVLPGDSFTVLASNAKVEDIENPQQGGDTKKYTVRLKAEYIDSEAPTPTHISWFKNDGTAAYATDENAVINAGVNIHEAPTREGYTFLGWARVATSTSTDYDTAGTEAADWEASSANWTQNLTAYDLYLTYNEAEGETAAYYTIADGTTVTQVAPDENLPYHAMFAVWEAEEDSLTYKPNGGTGENVVISENSLGEPYHVGETLAVATDESVNYTRAGYTFEGWNTKADGTGEDYSAGAKYTLTAGVDELYAQWSANENTQYTVRHWQQNIENDEYTEVVADRETKTGTTDTKTAAAAKTYTGFTAKTFEQKNIDGDGSTIVDIYYDRNTYTVTYKKGAKGTFEDDVHNGIRHGATTPTSRADTANEHEAGYTFTGWLPTVEQTVTAAAEYVAQWSANENTQYTVKHWQQNITDDEYTEVEADRETKTGTTDTQTAAEAKNYPGFTAKEFEQKTIAGDGSTVVDIYYDRDTYTVKYQPGDHGTFEEQTTENVKYGATTPAAPGTTGEAGYTFTGWSPEVATTVTADATYVAQWSANENTQYTVKHWQQNITDDEYTEVEADRETKTGTTDTQTAAEAKNYPGFTAKEFEQKNIDGDGSTIVDIYYDRNTYTVTYTKGDKGTFEDDVHSGIKHGATTPASIADTANGHAAGYTFTGWLPTVAETVTAVAEYVAQWSANENTQYTVRHWQQNIDNDEYTEVVADRETKTGTTDTKTAAAAKTYTGFTAKTFEQKNIDGDGSTIVDIYYDRNTYTVIYQPGDHGTFEEQKTESVKYGATTPAAPETTGAAGYTFTEWSPGVAATVTADATYVAQWSANENTKYTVRHWQQNIDNDEYTEVVADRETKTGTTDTKTAAAAKTYTGFTAQSFEQQNIAGDGTTVVDIYYNRNKYDYTVTHYTVEADGTIAPYDKPVVESALYGSVINATDVILEEIAEYLYDHAENKDKTTVESITIDVADNILNLFYDADKIGTVDPGEPDNVPDKYQVTINYVAESGGTISGKTKEVLTVVPYAESPDDKTAGTVTTTGSTAQANRNYSFTNWSAGGQTSDNGVFTLDVEGGKTYDITANFQYSGGGGGTPIDDPDVPLDLTTDHYAYVEGYEDGTVKPEGKITRAETATMIYRLLTVDRRDEVFTDQNNYSDVNKPDWYNKAVSSMTKGEYINGYPDGTFKGSNSITRAEFVTILVRFLDGPRDGDLPFSDVKGHWAEQYITTAVQAGWIDGYPDGTFQPDKEISRAEAMKIINTVLHRGVNEHSELGDYINFPDNSDASKWYYYELIEAVNDHEAENERPDENWISNKCEFVYDIDKYERP